MLRNTGKSPYVKEYTYLQSDESHANGQRQARKPDPRDHGFSYMDSDKASPVQQGEGATTSPSKAQQATGLAFAYKLDNQPYTPYGTTRTPTSQKSPAAITPLSSSPKKGSIYGSTTTTKPKEFYTTSPKSVTYPVKSSPAMVTLEDRSTTSKARTPSAMSGAGSTGAEYSQHIGGRGSRLSKDSKLEHSSSESISSGSSLDQYEKENVGSIKASSSKTAPSATTSKPVSSPRTYTGKPAESTLIKPAFGKSPLLSSSSAKSPPPPVLPKPTSLFDSPSSSGGGAALKSSSSFQQNQRATMYGKDGGYGQPTITHASRKLMVTNADGSTIETEEILEPETMTSHSTTTKTKPVVVGVVPSSYSRSDSV